MSRQRDRERVRRILLLASLAGILGLLALVSHLGGGAPVQTVWARYSRFTWWQMPVPGGTTRKLLKAFWPHLRNV